MAERFFAPAIGPDDTVRLTDEEAHHLARVRRIRRGERVQVFDGSGIECDATVRDIGQREVVLTIDARKRVSRELPFSLTLACSPAKGERLRWLIEKATELGVASFVPILTERSSEQARGLRADKTRRWVIESCKQCGRNVLMEVADAISWTEFLATRSSSHETRLLASPLGERLRAEDAPSASRGIAVAVGPEGGFTSAEIELAASLGWRSVTLGPRVLRVETAALAIVAGVLALTESRANHG